MMTRKTNKPPPALFRIITVRKTILAAARQLEQIARAEGGPTAIDRAERKMNDSRRLDDRAGLQFWRSVWIHLMSVRYAAAEVRIIESEEPAQNIPATRH
jgi:hypothetical protein